jgi:hypothetical protein
MRRLAILPILALALLCCGCLTQEKLRLSTIILASQYNGPGNYTEVKDDLLGDDETVFFYAEVKGFQTQKVDRNQEFWVTIDISIADSAGNVYLEKKNEKEIHVTNATEKPAYVYYKYPWYTGNLVLSGTYLVKIVATDKISQTFVETSKEFRVDLNMTKTET